MKKHSDKSLLENLSTISKSSEYYAIDELNSEIRLGIFLSDEKAKQEFLKNKAKAPLTTEEKIFRKK